MATGGPPEWATIVVIPDAVPASAPFPEQARTHLDHAAAGEPKTREGQGDGGHGDGHEMRVGETQHQEAQPDADHEPWQQGGKIGLRPGRGLPIDQGAEIHDDEQRRQEGARLQRIHGQGEQRNAHDGEAAAKGALHKGDQKDSGEGEKEEGRRRNSEPLGAGSR